MAETEPKTNRFAIHILIKFSLPTSLWHAFALEDIRASISETHNFKGEICQD